MALLFKDVNPGQRFLFYTRNCCQESEPIMFRGNFIKIINTTVIINNVASDQHCEYNNCGILTMPLDWITKVETLDDITNQKLLIPSEIMLEIDLFF